MLSFIQFVAAQIGVLPSHIHKNAVILPHLGWHLCGWFVPYIFIILSDSLYHQYLILSKISGQFVVFSRRQLSILSSYTSQSVKST